MNTESTTPTNPVPESSEKKSKSTLEKVLFRGFLLISVVLIAFEARAKFGYDYSLNYLKRAMAVEEFNVAALRKETEAGKKDDVKTVAEETEDATWGGLRSDAFEKLSFLAPLLAGQASEPIKFKPVLARDVKDGSEVKLRDKDGKVLELQAETSFERSLRWHSIRDLWMPEPAYLLTVKVAKEGEDADIVGFNNGAADGDMGKYFANPDRLAPAKFDATTERSVIGIGPGPGAGGGNGNGQGRRRRRPGSDEDGDEDKKDEDEAKTDEADGDDSAEMKEDDASEEKADEVSDDESENKEKSSEDENDQ